jgi:1,4-dihydroxy-2-naphthoyl-CoA synthase
VGFLDELVEPAALQGRTNALARIIEGNAPAALAGMKRHLNLISQGKYEPAAITTDHQRSLRSADLAEGLAALKAKRAPKFQGK